MEIKKLDNQEETIEKIISQNTKWRWILHRFIRLISDVHSK